jgi:excisionase family DNA binding protein
MKDIFSTFDVAKICKVDITSVINWVKAGRIKAHKTPGGHRRIKRKDLITFLEKYNFPISEEMLKTGPVVLVVEDDNAIRKYTMNTIAQKWRDWKIYEAEDGFTAGKLMADKKPELVILDLKLPGIDGVEVCRLIRQDQSLSNTKVLAMTGYSTQETKKKIMDAGADGYIEKPLNKDKLIENIETLLDLCSVA